MPRVVYRTIPTSNHNNKDPNGNFFLLYIVLFLHQTTTDDVSKLNASSLYIVLFLHQTTTSSFSCSFYTELYIVLFLHQTTTVPPPQETYKRLYIVLFLHQTTTRYHHLRKAYRCISYYSYIKPQPSLLRLPLVLVVYRTIPTSNHNKF